MTAILRPRVALTLIQPWATLIVFFWKDIENRTWAPKPGMLKAGERFFVHAGKSVDRAAFEWALIHVPGFRVVHPTIETLPMGAILGDVRFDGAVTGSASKWWVGPIGWRLADPKPLPTRVPCSGALGLWRVPEGVMTQIARAA